MEYSSSKDGVIVHSLVREQNTEVGRQNAEKQKTELFRHLNNLQSVFCISVFRSLISKDRN